MEHVRVETGENVATLTVDRPEKHNAMDVETREQFRAALDDVADGDARVLVVRGAGDAFVTGGDIADFAEFDRVDGLEYLTEHAQGLYNAVADLSIPTIAAVDGHALGGGMELALACDIRLATPDARFGLPELELGIIPAGGGTQRLATVVGAGIARELVLTGRVLDADEAADIGLVNHVHPAAEFDERVTEMAERIADRAPLALRMATESLDRSLDVEAGLDFERVAGAFLFGTEDQHEGARAFLEDRDPSFQGR
ncbi:MAG: enoyl-CoA hydratase/isomerase family protein [Halorientalis sp.]